MPKPASASWQIVSSVCAFENAHVDVEEEELTTPTRTGVRWTTVHRKTAVAMAPVTAEGKFILIREERPPVRQTLWTFPAGQVDEENPAAARRVLEATVWRELVEETGYDVPRGKKRVCRSLGHFYTSPGFTSECLHLFMVRPVMACRGSSRAESTECIVATKAVSPAELRGLVAEGAIADGPSLAIVARLCARGWLDDPTRA